MSLVEAQASLETTLQLFHGTNVLFLWMLCHLVVGLSSLRTDALPSLLVGRVDALPPYLCCRSSHIWQCSFFQQVQLLVGVGLQGWRCSPRSYFCCWLFIVVFDCLPMFLQFFLFLVICDLVLVKLCLTASRIVFNCFLLNKIRAQARLRKKICRSIFLSQLFRPLGLQILRINGGHPQMMSD